MASNKDVMDFYELRLVLVATRDGADAALRFMDKTGIAVVAMGRRSTRGENGKRMRVETLVKQVKTTYKRRLKKLKQDPALRMHDPVYRRAEDPVPVSHTEKLRQQRQASAALIAQLDPTEPKQLFGNLQGLGALVRRGYITKKGDGYIKTEKEYVVAKHRGPASGNGNTTVEPWVTTAEAAKILGLSQAGVIWRINKKQLAAKRTKGPGGAAGKKFMLARADVDAARAAAKKDT